MGFAQTSLVSSNTMGDLCLAIQCYPMRFCGVSSVYSTTGTRSGTRSGTTAPHVSSADTRWMYTNNNSTSVMVLSTEKPGSQSNSIYYGRRLATHPTKGYSRSRAKVLRKSSKTTTSVVPSTGQGSTPPMRYALMLYPLPVYPQLMGVKPDTRRTQPRVTYKRQPAMHACMLKAI